MSVQHRHKKPDAAPMPHRVGTVKFYKSHDAWGIIEDDDGGPDVLLHAQCLRASAIYDGVVKGDRLIYWPQRNPKFPDKIMAARVQLIDDQDVPPLRITAREL